MDVSASWQSLELLQDSGLAGAVCLEVRGLNREQALQKLEKAKSVILNFRHHNQSAPIQAGLSLHAPYTCHPELLKRGADCILFRISHAPFGATGPSRKNFFLAVRGWPGCGHHGRNLDGFPHRKRLVGSPDVLEFFDGETNKRLFEEAGFEVLGVLNKKEYAFGKSNTFLWIVAQKPEMAPTHAAKRNAAFMRLFNDTRPGGLE